MRNRAMRRSLAWLLTAATVMSYLPVSAAEAVVEPEAGEEVVLDAEEEAAEAVSNSESESTEETDGAEGFIEGIEEVPTVDEAAETESESAGGDTCSYVYTGQEITVAVPDGETVTGGTASAVNVGEYTVELVNAEGVTQELTWEITPATLTATCYYAEVKADAEDSTEAETEASEEAAGIEVAVEVTGFVNGEDEESAAGYVAPQYTQPSSLEEAALLTAFGGEADNYVFAYADSVNVSAENAIATLSAGEENGVTGVVAPASSVESLQEGTYTVNANIIVYPNDNQVLPGVTVYMTGPNVPPTAPEYGKNATLTVNESGEAFVTVPLDNVPASIFTLQELTTGSDLEVKEVKKDEEKYGGTKQTITGRITEVTVKLGNLSGRYTFGDCKEFPTLLEEYKDMPLHLWVDLANAERTNIEDAKKVTLTDESTGAKLVLTSEDSDALKAYRKADFSVKKTTDETVLNAIKAEFDDQYVVLGDYDTYDVILKDESGNDLAINEQITAKLVVAPSFTAKANATKAYTYENKLEEIGQANIEVGESETTVTITKTGRVVVFDAGNSTKWGIDNYENPTTGLSMNFHYVIADGLTWETATMVSEKVSDGANGQKYYFKVTVTDGTNDLMPIYPFDNRDYATMQIPVESDTAKVLLIDQGKAKELKSTIKDGKATVTLFEGSADAADMLVMNLQDSYNAYKNDQTAGTYIWVTDAKIALEPEVPKSEVYDGKVRQGVVLNDTVEKVDGVVEAKNAGTYTATVKPKEGYTWFDGTTDAKIYNWSISKRSLTSKTYTLLPYNYASDEYTGELPTLDSVLENLKFNFVEGENESNAAGFVKPDKISSNSKAQLPDKTTQWKSGQYIVNLSAGLADNYYVSASHYVIVGNTPETDETLTKVKTDAVYTGSGQYPLTTSNWQYALKDADGNAVDASAFVDAGTYEGLTIEPKIDTNTGIVRAAWSDGTMDAKKLDAFTIEKAKLSAKVEDQTIEVYDGTQTPEVTVSGFVAAETAVSAKDYVAPTAFLPEVVEPGKTYEVIPDGGSAKNYKFTEYTPGTITVEKVAVKKPVVIDNIPYSGKQVNGVLVSGAGYTVEGDVSATNAGTYTATIKLDEGYVWDDETYSTDDMTITWTITPATATIPAAVTGLVYNGQTQRGVTANETCTVTGNTAINAGSYTATVVPTANYIWADGSKDVKTITWQIAKKPVVVPVAATNLVYNGQAQKGVQAGEGYTVAGNTQSNAGEYIAAATLDQNHVWANGSESTANVSWRIARKTVAKPVAETSLVYNGQTQTGVAAAEGYSVVGNMQTKVGNYAAIATLDANHAWADGTTTALSVKWSIAKADQKIAVKNASKSYKLETVKKKAQNFTIGATASGKVSYKVTATPSKKAAKYFTVNKKGKVTVKKGAPAGAYTVTVSAAETDTYKSADVKVIVKVKKQSQKVSAKVSSKTIKTKKIAKKNATFTIGAKGKGKLTYKVTATPENAAKYISVNKNGKVTVKKKAPKGTYKITVTAAGNATYAKATKTITVKVK